VAVAAALEFNMRGLRFLSLMTLLLPLLAVAELQVVIIEGLGGEPRYTEQFAEQVSVIESASGGLTSAERVQVFRSGDFTRESVIEFFADLDDRMQADDRLAVYLIGHGSYDDHEYKFNIGGPDLTDGDLADLLDGIAGGQLIINTGSASGATLDRLKGDNRTLILATRSGAERHATRFGNYFAAALADPTADLDKNRVVTAEEAFGFAERQVTDYYERNGQLATEHPRIEGEQAVRFSLARLGEARPVTSDSELRILIARRDSLNVEIEDLRLRRDRMAPDVYQSALLNNMLELATLEEEIERRETELQN
jgi:hypothetical protein